MTASHGELRNIEPTSPALRLDDPGDCLGLVELTFGTLPEASLVVIGMMSGTTGGHLRMDLPERHHMLDAAQQAAEWIAGPQAEPAPEAVVLLLFTEPEQACCAELIEALTAILAYEHGVPTAQVWTVAAGVVFDADQGPRGAVPVARALAETYERIPQLVAHRSSAETPAWRTAAGGEEAAGALLAREPETGWPEPDAVQHALPTRAQEPYQALSCWDIAINETLRTGTLDWVLHPGRIAALVDGLRQRRVVEALLPLATLGMDTAWAGCRLNPERLMQEPGLDVSPQQRELLEHYVRALFGAAEKRPHWARVEAFEQISNTLVPYAGEQKPSLLVLSAWLWWFKGYGTRADELTGFCRREFPEHTLARQLEAVMGAQGVCLWARIKRHSYSWWAAQEKHSPFRECSFPQ